MENTTKNTILQCVRTKMIVGVFFSILMNIVCISRCYADFWDDEQNDPAPANPNSFISPISSTTTNNADGSTTICYYYENQYEGPSCFQYTKNNNVNTVGNITATDIPNSTTSTNNNTNSNTATTMPGKPISISNCTQAPLLLANNLLELPEGIKYEFTPDQAIPKDKAQVCTVTLKGASPHDQSANFIIIGTEAF